MRISTKLLTLNLLLMFLFIAFVIAAVLIQGNSLALTGAQIRMEDNLDSTDSIIKVYLANIENILYSYADDPDFKSYLLTDDVENLSIILKDIDRLSEELQDVIIFDNELNVVANSSLLPNSENYSDLTYLDKVKDSLDKYVSGVVHDPITGNPSIAIAVPIIDKYELVGYMVGFMNLDQMTLKLRNFLGRDELLVLDRYGEPVISTEYDSKNLDQKVLFDDYDIYRLKQMMEEGFSFTEMDIHGENYVVGYKEYDDFSLLYAKQSTIIYFIVYSIFMTVTVFSAIILVIFGLLIYLTSGTIAKPIKELSNKVDRITKGNLDIQLKKSNLLEIDNLIDSLNRILASLKLAILRTGARKSDFGIGEALQAKKKAEKRFSIIFESAPRGIFTVKDNKVTSWNKKAEQITGYNENEIIGKEASIFIKDSEKCLKSKDKKNCVFKTKDQNEIIVSLNKEDIEDNKGDVQEQIIIFEDITSRVKKEKETDFRNKELYSLMEEMNDLIYVSDMESYEIIYANKPMREQFGEDIVGKRCHDVIRAKNEPCGKCIIKKVKDMDGKPYVWQYHNPILNKDFQVTDRMIRWPDGRDVRFEIAHDITNMKKKDMRSIEVKPVEAKAKKLLDSIPTMIWVLDKEDKFLDANDQLLKKVGLTKNKIVGRNVVGLVPNELIFTKGNPDVMRSGKPKYGVMESVETPDGVRRVWKSDKIPYYKDGKVIGVLGFSVDVTDKDYKAFTNMCRSLDQKTTNTAWYEMDAPDGKITFIDNRSRMLGYPKSRFKTYKDLLNLVHPDDAKKVKKGIEDLLKGKMKSFDLSYRMKKKSGKYRHYKEVGVVTETTDEGVHMVGIVWEISSKSKK